MPYINRQITNEIIEAAKAYPVITLTGPRQSGKTTLVKELFKQLPYQNLELKDIRNIAIEDPRSFLAQFPNGAIIDEVQYAPDLLSYIQVMVDENPNQYQFVLTGQNQFALNEAISQSLAGRTDVLHLYPLSASELSSSNYQLSTNQQILSGFYPRLYEKSLEPRRLYGAYIQTYVERDVRNLLNVKDLLKFEQFLTLCAGRIGQVVNQNALANELGLSSSTINAWVSILEASYLAYRLPPYFENIKKRVIKSPKLYFCDVGLACYLLGIETENQLMRDNMRGHLFENLVITEILKHFTNQGRKARLFYYRDSNANEVDLIAQCGYELMPFEIKSSKTFHTKFVKGLEYFSELLPERIINPHVIYDGDLNQEVNGIGIVNWRNLNRILK